MPARRYLQLDVFADRPGAGNPLGVVLDGAGLDDAAMQAIARWTRLPETTFVLPAGASLQSLLRNPLAEPYLLGVSNGAAVGTMRDPSRRRPHRRRRPAAA